MNEKVERHPAYGVAVFCKTQGNPGKLFGSQLTRHSSAIKLTIHNAKRSHHEGRDWIWPEQELVRVYFSPAQFARLLTHMNEGEGTPCTIKSLGNNDIPDIPETEKTEAQRCYGGFEERLKALQADTLSTTKEILDLLRNKPTINKGDRIRIAELMNKINLELDRNMPYQLEAFQESVEETTQQARVEIDSMIETAIHIAGVESLQGKDRALGSGYEAPVVPREIGGKDGGEK